MPRQEKSNTNLSNQENNENLQVTRKQRTVLSKEKFEQILRFCETKSLKELAELTNLSYSTIVKAIQKLSKLPEDADPVYEALFQKPGRKLKDKSELHSEIKDIFDRDNSLTQVGLREKLSVNLSLSQINREVKNCELKRKRLKTRPKAELTDSNKQSRLEFCDAISRCTNKNLLFLDESGFNLHTFINYGYSLPGVSPILHQPNSRGINNSLCAIISRNGIEHHKIINGAYNAEIFITFLHECRDKNVFSRNTLLILDNVSFHHSSNVKNVFEDLGIEVLYLPAYSPGLNLIENVFGNIKANLNTIRPRATTQISLKSNIERAIFMITNGLGNYYRAFWNRVYAVRNNE